MQAQSVRGPTQVRFENLPNVHARGHAQRIEHDFDWRTVRKIRHVFIRQDTRNHAFIPVTAGHLIADRQFALHGDVDFDQLDDARRQLVAFAQLSDLFVGDLFEHRNLPGGHLLDVIDLLIQARVLILKAHALQVARTNLLDYVAGLLAENRSQQLLFGGELRLALRRDFAHQNVARLHRRADANHTAFVQIAKERVRDAWNVARDFFRSQLAVARFDLEFLNVN